MAVYPWQRLTQQVLNFVFPPTCAVCRRVGVVLCESCLASLSPVPEHVCPACGRMGKRPFSRCYRCQKRPLPLTHIKAVYSYQSPIKELIHQLKYQNKFALSQPLGQQMAVAWLQQNLHPTLVIPVPLHPKREQKRGYNQAMLLAKPVCHQYDLPLTPAALRRVRFTRPQIELGAAQRQRNVEQAFVAVPKQVCGQHVLLVDDVCTTGATLVACAEALLDAGATAVSAYCLARAI